MPDSGRFQQDNEVEELRPSRRKANAYEDEAPDPVYAATNDRWERSAQLVQLLHSRRRFLIYAVLLGTSLSIAAAFLMPKRYESTARLMPPDNQMNPMLSMLMGGLADKIPASISSGLTGGKSSSGLFAGVLASRTIKDKLIDEFDLRKVYRVRYLEDARKILGGNTEISEDKKSGIISITVNDKDPVRASKMAAAYVEELNRLMALVSTSSARRERVFIEGRLKDVRAELNVAAQKFSQFASKNSTLDIKEQTAVMVGAAADLQGNMIAAESELQGLQQVYGPENVRVRTVAARIATLRKELQKMSGSSDPTKLGEEEQMYPSIRKLPLLGVEWANLYRDTKVQEKVLELLTQQYEMSKIQEVKETPTAKLLDEPIVPEKKVWPPRGIIGIAGLLLSFLLSAGWVVVHHSWNGTPEGAPAKRFTNAVVRTFKKNDELNERQRVGA